MKFFGIFLLVLGFVCFFMPFLQTAPGKPSQHPQKGYESVTQTELGSVYPLMGISAIATGGALIFASIVTNEKGRNA